jgi:hypothetical protein
MTTTGTEIRKPSAVTQILLAGKSTGNWDSRADGVAVFCRFSGAC